MQILNQPLGAIRASIAAHIRIPLQLTVMLLEQDRARECFCVYSDCLVSSRPLITLASPPACSGQLSTRADKCCNGDSWCSAHQTAKFQVLAYLTYLWIRLALQIIQKDCYEGFLITVHHCGSNRSFFCRQRIPA